MSKKQSPLLTAFYRAYVLWIVHGALETDSVFNRGYGLCKNLEFFIKEHLKTVQLKHWDLTFHQMVRHYEDEMGEQFRDAGLSELYPFNPPRDKYQAQGKDYGNESDKLQCHKNLKRLQWVESHAKDQSPADF